MRLFYFVASALGVLKASNSGMLRDIILTHNSIGLRFFSKISVLSKFLKYLYYLTKVPMSVSTLEHVEIMIRHVCEAFLLNPGAANGPKSKNKL